DESAPKPDLKLVPNADPTAIFNDLEALRKASKLTVKRQTVRVNVPVERPANNVYFRTHTTLKLENATVIKDKDGTRDVYYFIVPDMRGHPKLAPRLRPVTIMLTCTWPATDFCYGRCRRRKTSRRGSQKKKAADKAQTYWTQLVWDPEKADFNVEIAEKINIEPAWPKESFAELLKIGFADLIVDNEDHYYVRRLLGIID